MTGSSQSVAETTQGPEGVAARECLDAAAPRRETTRKEVEEPSARWARTSPEATAPQRPVAESTLALRGLDAPPLRPPGLRRQGTARGGSRPLQTAPAPGQTRHQGWRSARPAMAPNRPAHPKSVGSEAPKTRDPRPAAPAQPSAPPRPLDGARQPCRPTRREPTVPSRWKAPRQRLRYHRAAALATRHQPS